MNALLPLTISAWVFAMTVLASKYAPIQRAREAVQQHAAGAARSTTMLGSWCDYGGTCKATAQLWDMAPVGQFCWRHEQAARRDHPHAERREGLAS